MKLAQRLALGYIRTRLRLLSKLSPAKAAEKAFDLFCTPQVRNRKKFPPVFEKAEKLHIPFRDFRLAGYRWNKGAGRKIMIIHGFESSVINYDRYIKPFTDCGYEVVAFDAPAHGRSTGKRINALIFKDFIKHIHTRLGPMDAFMAHSFGGLALCLALEELEHTAEMKIVLVAPLTETTTSMQLFYHFLQLDKPVQKEFENIITVMGKQPPAWYSIRRAVHQIRARVLWFHDEEDNLTPFADALKVKKDHHPHIEFVISKGLGHRRIYRDNEVKKKIVGFFCKS